MDRLAPWASFNVARSPASPARRATPNVGDSSDPAAVSRRFAAPLVLALVGLGAALPGVQAQGLAWSVIEGRIERTHPGLPTTTTARLAERLARGEGVVLIDARSEAEYAVSHLPDAQRLDPDAPASALADVPRQTPVVVYCSVGWRSAAVVARLRAAGHTRAENLRGSIFRWAIEGRPLVDGADRPVHVVHPYDAVWGRLLPAALRAR